MSICIFLKRKLIGLLLKLDRQNCPNCGNFEKFRQNTNTFIHVVCSLNETYFSQNNLKTCLFDNFFLIFIISSNKNEIITSLQ